MPCFDSYEPDDDSLGGFEFPRALEPPWKKVVKVVGVVVGLAALVGYGIWIGTIQANITELKKLEDDVKETKKSFLELDSRTTNRLDNFRETFYSNNLRNSRDIGELKEALFAFSTEMRYRHHTEPPIKPFELDPIPPGADPIPISTDHKILDVMARIRPFSHDVLPKTAPSPRRATRKEINEAAKNADQLIHKVLH